MKMIVSYPSEISEVKIELLTYSNNESRIMLQEILQLPLTDVSINAFKKIQQNINNEGSDLNEKGKGFGI
tara:strand:- start:2386 stop:2595 length:210 start_codon:yes stop_codon:yes gene_type:complete